MATKNDLQRTLKRTAELAREAGLLHTDDSLILDEPAVGTTEPWGVHRLNGIVRIQGDLLLLPDSGRSIGSTKRQAQQTLQTVNGVLVAVIHKRSMDKLGYGQG